MITALVSILVGAIVASIAAWLYSRRWPAPQPRARITREWIWSGYMWKVVIHNRRHGLGDLSTHWVHWSDALDFANSRVDFERKYR